MFGYTSFVIDRPTSKSSRPESPSISSRRGSPPSTRLTQPSLPNSHNRPVQYQTQTRTFPKESGLTERFSNRTYNRLPSPPGVMVRAGSAAKGTRDILSTGRAKNTVRPSSPKVRPVSERRSDIITRPLQAQGAAKARPRTGITRRTADKGVQESTESKILMSVKDVLGHLIMLKGTIDESDLDKVMKYTKSHLRGEEVSDDEDGREIKVEPKWSRTTVNVDMSSLNVSAGRKKPFVGIMRKEVPDTPKRGYRRFYGVPDSSLEKCESSGNLPKDETREDEDTLCPEIVKINPRETTNKIEFKKSLFRCIEKEFVERKSRNNLAPENLYGDEQVGDSQANDSNPLDLWKPAEEIDLRSYIESLVKNMNHEMKIKTFQPVTEDNIKVCDDVCKSFCICKVCTSDRNPSKHSQPINSSQSQIIRAFAFPEMKSKITIKSSSPTTPVTSNAKASKMAVKASSTGVKLPRNLESFTEPNCKELKRNKNVQPGSKVDFLSRPAIPEVRRRGTLQDSCYTHIDPVSTEEAGADLYLQRRKKHVMAKKAGP